MPLIKYWPAAAAILLCASGIYFLSKPQVSKQITYTTITTVAGERKTITLPDNSIITLNNASTIRYTNNYNEISRDIYITGEAFFNVKHQTTLPFRVHHDKLTVQVLGTSFDVKAYRDEKLIEVAVATGKVGVMAQGHNKASMLLPGDHLSYNRLNGNFTQLHASDDNLLSWTRNELTVNEQQLQEVCHQLERWYGVKIKLNNKRLMTKKVSLKIKGDDLGTVMQILAISGDFNYKINNREINIYPY